MKCNAHQMGNGVCGLTGGKCIGKACMYFAPDQTNADRIRAMSDRELAAFLADSYVAESRLRLEDKGIEATATALKELHERLHRTWLYWLQQPAEGNEYGKRFTGDYERAELMHGKAVMREAVMMMLEV